MAFSPALPKALFLCFLVVNCLLWSHSNFARVHTRSARSGSDVGIFKREVVNVNGTIHSLLERVALGESGGDIDEDCAPLSVPISEQCAHVKASCDVASSFLSIQYLEHYFCSSPTARPAIFILFLLWLFFLFSTLGISASDFFCPNLSTISELLGLDENVAGVTLLAFGNGSPDVFSTFSAMRADAGSLAVGELIGAASFIVSCVAGSLCIIKPFHVNPGPFLRDAGFFTVAVCMLLVILWDGEIRAWEAGSLVGLYVTYVIAVALGTWWEKRRSRKIYLEAVARGEWDDDEISIPPTLVEEQYHDETPPPEISDSLAVPSPYVRTRAHSSPGAIPHLGIDTSVQGQVQFPFPHQQSSRSPSPTPSGRRHRHTSSHVGHMPSFSLIGALEFREVVASLRNQSASTTLSMFESPATPYHSHSLHGSLVGRQSLSATGRRRSHYSTREREITRENSHQRSISHGGSGSGTLFRSGPDSGGFELDPWDAAGRDIHAVPLNERSPSVRSPVDQPRQLQPLPDEDEQSQPDSQPGIKLQVPSHSRADRDISTSSAPPGISSQPSRESNATGTTVPYISRTPASPTSPTHSQSDLLSPSASASSFLGLSLETENPQHSSSYDASHSTHPQSRKQRVWTAFTHILRVLFPTLRDFREKSVMWGMASILAAPAVLMLTLTLPVHVIDKDVEREYEKVGLGAGAGGINGINNNRGSGVGPAEGRLVDFEEEGVERLLTAEEEVEQEMHGGHFNKWLMAVQCALGPLFCVAVLFAGTKHEIWLLIAVAVGGLAAALLVAVFADKGTSQSAQMARCFMGFFVAIVWIMAIADEVVNVLKTFGFVFGLSDAIIGLTIFAVGNSLADLIANISVAAFAPVMGFSACFGGPMLNILLGIGVSGSYIIQQASGEPYRLHFSRTLLVSTVGLLTLLVCTLVFVPWNGFHLTRKWGLFLILCYVVIMVTNIVVEIRR